jgi:hypothetical protein
VHRGFIRTHTPRIGDPFRRSLITSPPAPPCDSLHDPLRDPPGSACCQLPLQAGCDPLAAPARRQHLAIDPLPGPGGPGLDLLRAAEDGRRYLGDGAASVGNGATGGGGGGKGLQGGSGTHGGGSDGGSGPRTPVGSGPQALVKKTSFAMGTREGDGGGAPPGSPAARSTVNASPMDGGLIKSRADMIDTHKVTPESPCRDPLEDRPSHPIPTIPGEND